MSIWSDIAPKNKQRVIDAVQAAGIDVTDWGNYVRGPSRAAVNPKYCYEWSYVEPARFVVLNLWHEQMKEENGVIVEHANLRETAQQFTAVPNRSMWVRRAMNMDGAIQEAFRLGLPVRVIICAGRRHSSIGGKASKVTHRTLDQVEWHVRSYNYDNGQCTLVRGAPPERFVDQFELYDEQQVPPERRSAIVTAYDRSSVVRKRVLTRAQGLCEWCGQPGVPDG